MNTGLATLLTSLGLILIALPWVFGVQRLAEPATATHKHLNGRS